MTLFRLDVLRRAAAHRVGGPLLATAGSMTGFVAAALLGFEVVDAGSGLVAFWPPNGVVVALFVLLPPRLRPWILLGVLPGELIADSIHGYPLLVALGFSLTDLLESAIAGVVLLRVARRPPRGTQQRDFYALMTAACVAPLISGLLGAAISHAQWDSPYQTSLILWWLGDMTGILVVVALAMSFVEPRLSITRLRRSAAVIEVAIVVVVTLAVFGPTSYQVTFVVLAPLTLLAIRKGLRATALGVTAFAVTTSVMTAHGYGSIAAIPGATARMVTLQTFVAVMSFTVFLISATMSERRHAEAALVDLATHDPLTGLANRRLFLQQLERAAARTARSTESSAIVLFDLDGFKEINDRFGHATGDAILVEAGRRLAEATRKGELVARLGGDEFAGLLEPVDGIAGADLAARRIADLIEQPYRLGDLVLPIRVSVGTTLVTDDVDLSMRRADEELYRDKPDPTNRTQSPSRPDGGPKRLGSAGRALVAGG